MLAAGLGFHSRVWFSFNATLRQDIRDGIKEGYSSLGSCASLRPRVTRWDHGQEDDSVLTLCATVSVKVNHLEGTGRLEGLLQTVSSNFGGGHFRAVCLESPLTSAPGLPWGLYLAMSNITSSSSAAVFLHVLLQTVKHPASTKPPLNHGEVLACLENNFLGKCYISGQTMILTGVLLS